MSNASKILWGFLYIMKCIAIKHISEVAAGFSLHCSMVVNKFD